MDLARKQILDGPDLRRGSAGKKRDLASRGTRQIHDRCRDVDQDGQGRCSACVVARRRLEGQEFSAPLLFLHHQDGPIDKAKEAMSAVGSATPRPKTVRTPAASASPRDATSSVILNIQFARSSSGTESEPDGRARQEDERHGGPDQNRNHGVARASFGYDLPEIGGEKPVHHKASSGRE